MDDEIPPLIFEQFRPRREVVRPLARDVQALGPAGFACVELAAGERVWRGVHVFAEVSGEVAIADASRALLDEQWLEVEHWAPRSSVASRLGALRALIEAAHDRGRWGAELGWGPHAAVESAHDALDPDVVHGHPDAMVYALEIRAAVVWGVLVHDAVARARRVGLPDDPIVHDEIAEVRNDLAQVRGRRPCDADWRHVVREVRSAARASARTPWPRWFRRGDDAPAPVRV